MSVSKIKKVDEKQRKNKGMMSVITSLVNVSDIFTTEDMENISLISQM